jgi:hypothetical protein
LRIVKVRDKLSPHPSAFPASGASEGWGEISANAVIHGCQALLRASIALGFPFVSVLVCRNIFVLRSLLSMVPAGAVFRSVTLYPQQFLLAN